MDDGGIMALGGDYMRLFGVLIASVLLIVTGCTININGGLKVIAGSGVVVEVEEAVDTFTEVEVHQAFDVEVVQGDAHSVVIEIDDNLVEYLEVFTQGDRLSIGLKPNNRYKKATLKAVVTLAELGVVDGSGATSIGVSDGVVISDQFELRLSGASSFNGKLEAESVVMSLSGASSANAEMDTSNLEIDLSGASDVSGSGQADHVKIELSGASDARLSRLDSKTAQIDVSGASDVALAVSDQVEIDASGAASVTITGHPSVQQQNISGGADVKFK